MFFISLEFSTMLAAAAAARSLMLAAAHGRTGSAGRGARRCAALGGATTCSTSCC